VASGEERGEDSGVRRRERKGGYYERLFVAVCGTSSSLWL
jgi:hypothetical protein